MASTGNNFPTSGASVDRAGSTAWTNPGNVVSDNASDTTAAVPTDYLVCSSFGFSVPESATITGVTVRVEASETGTGSSNYIPQLISAATPTLIGSAKSAVTVTGTTKVISTNGGTNDTWSATLTPAIVNDAGFGVAIWSTDATNTLAIDFVTIAIEYTTPELGVVSPDAKLGARSPGYGILSGGGISPNLPLGLRGKVGPPSPGAVGITNLRPVERARGFGPEILTGPTGSVAVTEGSDTSAIAAQAKITGASAVTEGDDTSAITAQVTVYNPPSGKPSYGVLSGGGIAPNLPLGQRTKVGPPYPGAIGISTLHPAGLYVFARSVGQTGSVTVAEAADTSAIAAQVRVLGTLAVTEAADTCVATSQQSATGTLDVAEENDTLFAGDDVELSTGLPSYGVLSGGGVVGRAGQSPTVGYPATGTPIGIGVFRATWTWDTLNFGAVGTAGNLAVSEADDTSAAAAELLVRSTLAVAEAADVSDVAAQLNIGSTLAIAEANDTLAASGLVGAIVSSANVTEEDDPLASAGQVSLTGSLEQAEASDTLSAAGSSTLVGSLAIAEANDGLAGFSEILVVCTADITERDDVLGIVADQEPERPKPGGHGKPDKTHKKRSKRWLLPDGTHVIGTAEQVQEIAEALLQRPVVVRERKPRKPIILRLDDGDIEPELILPMRVVQRPGQPEYNWILAEHVLKMLDDRKLRRRKAATLLLLS